jgi:hypothetical protein
LKFRHAWEASDCVGRTLLSAAFEVDFVFLKSVRTTTA